MRLDRVPLPAKASKRSQLLDMVSSPFELAKKAHFLDAAALLILKASMRLLATSATILTGEQLA